ncbi:MAG: hypothetical protein SWN98_13500 [Pseudomonadota bacterium]|jgi:hypothetical protein|nr:hypothetical protein [Pseudomonadota bacterium]
MKNLTNRAWVEIARRVGLQAGIVAAAILGIGHSQALAALASLAAGIALYIAIPRPQPAAGTLYAARIPSIYAPDFLAALLAPVFLALPFIVAVREENADLIPGLMLMTWLPGSMVLYIHWIAARYQCLWLQIEADGLTLGTMHGARHIAFAEIDSARTAVKRPPRWLPSALTLFGGLRGAGIAALHGHRRAHWLILHHNNGTRTRIPLDALLRRKELFHALERAGKKVEPETMEATANV